MKAVYKAILTAVVCAFLSLVALAPEPAEAAGGAINPGQILEQVKQKNLNACIAASQVTTCWSCVFVDKFASAGLTAAGRAYDDLAPGFQKILFAIFGVWLLSQVLRMFLPDGPGLGALKGIAVQVLVMTVVLACLSEGGFALFSEYIFVPIMHGGGELSQAIMKAFGASGGDFGTIYGDLTVVHSSIAIGGQYLRETYDEILRVVGTMQQINTWGFLMGLYMTAGTSILDLEIGQFLGGLVLMFFFGVAIVAFPFYIIDLFFRAILLTALAPLAISSAAFKFSRRVTVAALTGLIQSAATVALLGAVVGLVSSLMTAALGMAGKASFPEWTCDIWMEKADVGFGFSKPEFWFLMCAGILSIGAMSKARGLVGALISGFDDGKSLGDKAAGWAGRGMMAAGSWGIGLGILGAGATKAGLGATGSGGIGVLKAAAGHIGSVAMASVPGGQAAMAVKTAANIAKSFSPDGMKNGNPDPKAPGGDAQG